MAMTTERALEDVSEDVRMRVDAVHGADSR
jgi:hypothetical protein